MSKYIMYYNGFGPEVARDDVLSEGGTVTKYAINGSMTVDLNLYQLIRLLEKKSIKRFESTKEPEHLQSSRPYHSKQ